MKHVRSFTLFENETTLNPGQIKFLDKHTKGGWRVNPTTGLVDVKGDFDCSYKKLKDLMGINFGVVSGSFSCSDNQLASLEGAPQEVGKDFHCSRNQLTTLEGAPQRVGDDFYCSYNQLTILEGAPEKVGGDFNCFQNQLTSLKGAPQEVGEDFYCSHNQLTTLEGAPEKVGGSFSCFQNQLTSLKGAPQEVGEDFYLESSSRFKWTTEGKLEYMAKNPKWVPLIAPTLPYDSLLDVVSETPTLLKAVENFDKVLYNKILKGLGWDKMGPDLLRQVKDGII